MVDSERYLALYRYIELDPVRAPMVDALKRYRWSSARANLGINPDAFPIALDAYLALAPMPLSVRAPTANGSAAEWPMRISQPSGRTSNRSECSVVRASKPWWPRRLIDASS